MKGKINYLLIVLACVATLPACAGLMYSAEPMEAKVVDAQTKQPLEGVVIVAHWQLERGTLGGSVPAGQLMIMETVTDKDGRFSFPGFGPKAAGDSHLVHKDPELILFKSGYQYRVLTNQYSSDMELRTRAVRRSEWNGKVIEMKPYMGALEVYVEQFKSFNNNIESIAAREPKGCAWRKIPDTIRTINRERKQLVAQGANPNTLSSIDERLIRNDEYFARQGNCGSPREFFHDIQP